MNSYFKTFLALTLALVLCTFTPPVNRVAFAAQTVRGEEPNGFEMALDALVARPLMLGLTLVGSVAFVLSLPFSVPAGSVQEARRKMVVEPAIYTFKRPLGRVDRDCDASCYE